MDWWVRDFTLKELKTLKVRQPNNLRPKLESQIFKISTFEEVLLKCLEVKSNKTHILKDAGLLVELKGWMRNQTHETDLKLPLEFIKILK